MIAQCPYLRFNCEYLIHNQLDAVLILNNCLKGLQHSKTYKEYPTNGKKLRNSSPPTLRGNKVL